MVDFCTCNQWDWIVHGLSCVKTDKRHKRKTAHLMTLRLVSPIDDNTYWVNLEINKLAARKSPAKRLMVINTWIEKAPKGFKLYRGDETTRFRRKNQ